MKKQNRGLYAVIGVIILLMAGLVYAWSVMAKPIGASRPWTAAQLSLTFTLVMVFFCIPAVRGPGSDPVLGRLYAGIEDRRNTGYAVSGFWRPVRAGFRLCL